LIPKQRITTFYQSSKSPEVTETLSQITYDFVSFLDPALDGIVLDSWKTTITYDTTQAQNH